MKKRGAIILGAALALFSAARGETVPEDRVLIFDMKEDPTLASFVGNPLASGFYGLELDDVMGRAAVLYRIGDILYRVDVDRKVKGDQLILKNEKRRKTLIRSNNAVYPIECPPEKGGWRRGASFGRHLVRVNDEEGRRLILGSAMLEFESALHRCGGPDGECGPSGCEDWGAAVSPSTAAAVASVSLSQTLLNGKVGDAELAANKKEIDSALPPSVGDLAVISTSARTSAFPYFGLSDPAIEQRGLRIGVLSKTYMPADKSEPITVEVEPLLAEFQAPAAGKCGTWEAGPNKTIFDLKGRAAMFIQTPGTGNAKENSSLIVCGQSVSLSIQTQSYRTQEALSAVFDALPLGRMEQLVGSGK